MLFYATQGTCSIDEAQRAAAAKAAAKDPPSPTGQDPAAAGGLFSLLDARHQSIVAPFLTTRFNVRKTNTLEGTGAHVL
jgi:hypothetical protein